MFRVFCCVAAAVALHGATSAGDARTTLQHVAPDRAFPQQVPVRFDFHHLHLNGDPGSLLRFYQRLFDPTRTRRITIAGVEGLSSDGTTFLVSRGATKEEPTALWHFGWGAIALNETYLAHARGEVAWEPPLPGNQLHLHLRSVKPVAAAAWYHNVLGLPFDAGAAAVKPGAPLPPPEFRVPEARIWIGHVGLLIYPSDVPLAPSRGHFVDHLSLGTANLDAALAWLRSREVRVVSGPTAADGLRTAFIEGPDGLAIEIVEGTEAIARSSGVLSAPTAPRRAEDAGSGAEIGRDRVGSIVNTSELRD